MNRLTSLLICLLLTQVAAADDFDSIFTGKTMRLDLFHTGNARQELVAIDRARIEGDWPGSRTRLLDDSNLGKYFFEVVDHASHELLYSRGFCSIYGEWETTSVAAEGTIGTLPEALLFPEPRQPFEVRLSKRDERLEFERIWTSPAIDPGSRFVIRAPVTPYDVIDLSIGGKPENKVDVLFLGDGYTLEEKQKFHDDCVRLTGELLGTEPFRSRRDDFNVRGVFSPSPTSGISNPRMGEFHDSPLGTAYNALDSDRYVLTLDDRGWRDVAAAAPYEFVIILVNMKKYGGGGIQNLYCTAAVDSAYSGYLVVHEFGHHFAGLGDEYFTSSVAYEEFTPPDVEPWEPNVTALLDPDQLKWKDLVTTGTPLPTPWKKQKYGELSRSLQKTRAELRAEGAAEDRLEDLFRREQNMVTEILGSQNGMVGAFEGAMYSEKGLYRPAADCIMFSRTDAGFCPVCSRAIERIIDLYATP